MKGFLSSLLKFLLCFLLTLSIASGMNESNARAEVFSKTCDLVLAPKWYNPGYWGKAAVETIRQSYREFREEVEVFGSSRYFLAPKSSKETFS